MEYKVGWFRGVYFNECGYVVLYIVFYCGYEWVVFRLMSLGIDLCWMMLFRRLFIYVVVFNRRIICVNFLVGKIS